MKGKVYKNTPRTIEQLKDSICQEIQAVNIDTLRKVFQNLEKRIQVCLDVKETSFSIDYGQVLFCIIPGMCI